MALTRLLKSLSWLDLTDAVERDGHVGDRVERREQTWNEARIGKVSLDSLDVKGCVVAACAVLGYSEGKERQCKKERRDHGGSVDDGRRRTSANGGEGGLCLPFGGMPSRWALVNILSGSARAGPLFASSARMPRSALVGKSNLREISEAEGDRASRLANAGCMHTHIFN